MKPVNNRPGNDDITRGSRDSATMANKVKEIARTLSDALA